MNDYPNNAAEQAKSALSNLSQNTKPDVAAHLEKARSGNLTSADYSPEQFAAGTRRLFADLDAPVPSYEREPAPQAAEISTEQAMNISLVRSFAGAQWRPASLAFGGHKYLRPGPMVDGDLFEQYDSYPDWYNTADYPDGEWSSEALQITQMTHFLAAQMCLNNPSFVMDVKTAPDFDAAQHRCMPLTTYAIQQYREMSKDPGYGHYDAALLIAKDASSLNYEDAYAVQGFVAARRIVPNGASPEKQNEIRGLMIKCPALRQYDPSFDADVEYEAVSTEPKVDVDKKSSFYRNVKERLFGNHKQSGLNEIDQPENGYGQYQ